MPLNQNLPSCTALQMRSQVVHFIDPGGINEINPLMDGLPLGFAVKFDHSEAGAAACCSGWECVPATRGGSEPAGTCLQRSYGALKSLLTCEGERFNDLS